MRRWLLRFLATLNLFFALGGLVYFAVMLPKLRHEWPPAASKTDWILFAAFTGLNLALVCALGYFGVKLLAGREPAIRLITLIFAAEILSFFAGSIVFWLIRPMYDIPFSVVSDAPITPQIVTAYPLIGLLLTLLLRRRRTAPTYV